MPLNENQALIARVFSGWVIDLRTWVVGGHNLETLLNACRLEERAKAEGEVEALRRERDDAKAYTELLDQSWYEIAEQRLAEREQQRARAETAESNLAKAEARIAELTQERPPMKMLVDADWLRRKVEGDDTDECCEARPDIDWKAAYMRAQADAVTQLARAEAALSRATQAEEVVEAGDAIINAMHRKSFGWLVSVTRDMDDAVEHWLGVIAKLKAAPLQGDGSISSSFESAARLASQVCDPTPPSSTGKEDQ